MLRREKRLHRRILVSVEAELKISDVSGSGGNPAPYRGVVTNLSTMGLSIRLSETHPVGTSFRVLLKLGEQESFFFATVRRVHAPTAYDPTRSLHGLQIVAASEEAIDAIYDYMLKVTGQTAKFLPNTVEAFPEVVNATLGPPKSDPPSNGSL